ncbi:MAG: type II toxin-antitoxin system RelE/ParE family toxin [Rhizomicrobium sp.]
MVAWAPEAVYDIGEAWAFIARDSEVAADRIVTRLTTAAERLDRFPRLGRPGPETGTRQFFVAKTPFKLIYRIKLDGEVELLRVYHTSQMWPKPPS